MAAQVAFCLPDDIPVAISTFNWTPVMLGIIFGAVLLIWYMPRFGARYWYHGKAHLLPDTGIVSSLLLTAMWNRCALMKQQ